MGVGVTTSPHLLPRQPTTTVSCSCRGRTAPPTRTRTASASCEWGALHCCGRLAGGARLGLSRCLLSGALLPLRCQVRPVSRRWGVLPEHLRHGQQELLKPRALPQHEQHRHQPKSRPLRHTPHVSKKRSKAKVGPTTNRPLPECLPLFFRTRYKGGVCGKPRATRSHLTPCRSQ